MKKLFLGISSFIALLGSSSVFAVLPNYIVPIEYVVRDEIANYIIPTIILLAITLILKKFIKNKKVMKIILICISIILAILTLACIILTLKVKLFN